MISKKSNIVILSILNSVILSSYAQSKNLEDYPETLQDYSNWCWVATTHSVLNFLEIIDSYKTQQCDIANVGKKVNYGCSGEADLKDKHGQKLGWGDWVNTPNELYGQAYYNGFPTNRGISVENILKIYGVKSKGYSDYLNWESIKWNLNYERPFYIRIGWKNANGNFSGSGHVMIGTGYSEILNSKWVSIMDPWNGNKITKYEELISNKSYAWTHSLELIP